MANTNDAPVVSAPISDQTAQENVPFQFTVLANTFADVDLGDTLSYAATRTDGEYPAGLARLQSNDANVHGTPPTGSVGNPLAVRVRSTDQSQASVSDDFTLETANVFTGTGGADTLVGTNGADVLYGLD